MMGRTIPTFRMLLEQEISSWSDYRRALRPDDRKHYDAIIDFARLKADAGSNVTRPILSEIMFMSILIEQQKQIDKLRLKLDIK
ncbi:MAG: hypothetical protein EAX96_16605 [Candidatus Lokiarchaeota archaeon]|nr:hypothetical protein [Candidatus Lokiarchaeota archaeon]